MKQLAVILVLLFMCGIASATLEKEIVTDQITVLEDGQMQIREVTRILEDGKILSYTYHRKVIAPGDDVTKEITKIKDIAEVVHTPTVINAYNDKRAKAID